MRKLNFTRLKALAILAPALVSSLLFTQCNQPSQSKEGSEEIVMMVDLVNDQQAIEAYEKYHEKVWPEVIEANKAAHIEQVKIYRTGPKLVMIITVPKDWDSEKENQNYLNSSPKVKEWIALMSKYQKPSAEAPAGTKDWTPMKLIFNYKDGKQH